MLQRPLFRPRSLFRPGTEDLFLLPKIDAEWESDATARGISGQRLHRQVPGIHNKVHGLTYRNVGPVSDIPQIVELNIGHNIVARASLVGMERAVREMLEAMSPAR